MYAARSGAGHGFGWFSRFVALAVAALAAGIIAGCDNDGAIAIDDIPASVEATYCQRAALCAGGPDPAACEAALFVSEDRNLTGLVAGVKQGTITYDGRRARECLDEFQRDCINQLAAPPACDETFRGTVAQGGACQISQECVSGQCDRACGNACCVGTCAAGPAKVPLGGDCSAAGSPCVGGSYCKSGKCTVDLPLGAACAADDVCRRPGQCTIGLGGGGTCLAAPDQGAACSPTDRGCLRSDNYCDPVAQVCVKRKAAGSACTDVASECATFAPCVNGLCTALLTLGQPCQVDGAVRCFGELECSNGVCAAPTPRDQCAP